MQVMEVDYTFVDEFKIKLDRKGRPMNDPNCMPVETHYLVFPLLQKDFNNWSTNYSSVILRDKVIVSPESQGLRGFIHTVTPNPIKENWIARIDFNIGRKKAAK